MASVYWKIRGLLWYNTLASYVMWLLMTYFLDEWGLSYKTASIIVNVHSGLISIMPIALQYIKDVRVGNYRMILLCGFTCSLGLVFFSFASLKSACDDNGSCDVNTSQKILVYTALPLLVVGGCVDRVLITLEELFHEDEMRLSKALTILGIFISIIVHLIGALLIPRIELWPIRFGVPAFCVLLATLTLIDSHIISTLRYIVASLLKRSKPEDNEVFRTRRSKYLNNFKPKIPESQQESNKQPKNNYMEESEKTKTVGTRISLCMVFIILGIMSAVGDSYFVAQAYSMDNKVGSFEVPIVILELFHQFSRYALPILYRKTSEKIFRNLSTTHIGFRGILVSMIFSILCFIAATLVESRRLDAVKRHVLYYADDETPVPMTVFWLVPQFICLGGLDGLAIESVDLFFNRIDPTHPDHIMRHFAMACFGFGKILSILSVQIVRKLSALGDNTSWFVENLNLSRFDKYCMVLIGLAGVNAIYCAVVYRCTTLRSDVRKDDGVEIEPTSHEPQQSDN